VDWKGKEVETQFEIEGCELAKTGEMVDWKKGGGGKKNTDRYYRN
jgi:hypothetical protein